MSVFSWFRRREARHDPANGAYYTRAELAADQQLAAAAPLGEDEFMDATVALVRSISRVLEMCGELQGVGIYPSPSGSSGLLEDQTPQ